VDLYTAFLHRLDAVIPSLFTYSLPLSAGGNRTGILLRLQDNHGIYTWGEIAPLPGRSKESLDEALAQLKAILLKTHRGPLFPSVACGIESALRPRASAFSVPLSPLLIGSAKEMAQAAERLINSGINHAKVKISGLKKEEALSLLQELLPHFSLRIDANRCFSFKEALSFFSHFDKEAFAYIEEPTVELDRLSDFSHPFALDESLLDRPDLPLETFPHLKALILKPTLLGGKEGCQQWIARAHALKISPVFSSGFESSIGLYHIAALAHELDLANEPIGIDTARYFNHDLVHTPLCFSSLSFPNINVDHLTPVPEEILCPIQRQANDHPNQIAILSDEGALTYQELNAYVHTLTAHLRHLQIKEKERVAFSATTHLNTVILLFALFRLKAIACPITPRMPQEQIPSLLERLNTSRFLDPLALSLHVSDTKENTAFALDQLATFLFTSGSSGTPKIACHTFGNHYFNAKSASVALKLTPSSLYYLSLPLYHVSGLSILFRSFIQGSAILLSPSFEKHPITHLSVVPTQLFRMLQSPDTIPSSLSCLLVGGAPLSQALFEQAKHLPLFTTYGMTEMSSIITLASPETLKEELHSGTPLADRELKISETQEILVRGKTLFQGYWNEKSESVIPVEEWFPTKDLGTINERGELQVIGRKDRQFISGGENIQPEEIERALLSLPGILAAAVFPLEDGEFGTRPIAFIYEKIPTYTLATLKEALKPLLPSFKHPIALRPYPKNAWEQGTKKVFAHSFPST
jgi:O-succinylbenzoic acid--CoA ligase